MQCTVYAWDISFYTVGQETHKFIAWGRCVGRQLWAVIILAVNRLRVHRYKELLLAGSTDMAVRRTCSWI